MQLLSLLLVILLAAPAGLAAAQPHAPRYYEVLLYLRGKGATDAVARSLAAVPATLISHRLSEPDTVRTWDGQGRMPVAFERRVVTAGELDVARIFDTDAPLRAVLGVPSAQGATAIAVMVAVPPDLDVAAYAEALRLIVGVAKALDAPAFLDAETRELRYARSFSARLTEGQNGSEDPVSSGNPPAMTVMDGFSVYEESPEGAWRTRGLRKLGLPDLALVDWVPGLTPFWLLDAVGNLMVSGKVPSRSGTTLELRVGQPEVDRALNGRGRPGGRVAMQLSASATPGLLQLDFEGPAGTQVYERQMLAAQALWLSDYAQLPEAHARELTMAVARTKSRIRELRSRFAAMRAQGTRVFVGTRMDLVVKSLPRLHQDSDWVLWDEVLAWTPEGRLTLRQWKGDPRAGGVPARFDPPLRVGEQVFENRESDIADHMIEDILLVDRAGKASGAEVTERLKRLIDQELARRRPGR